MRTRRQGRTGRLGAGVATTAVAGLVAAAALSSGQSGARPGGDRGDLAPVSTATLAPVGDCADLVATSVRAALPTVGAYGWNTAELRAATRSAASPAAEIDAALPSDTGTNVQEAGVDEPDLAKTDGRHVYRVRGDRVVVTDTAGTRPRTIARVDLPRSTWAAELLLVGGRLFVLGSPSGGWLGGFDSLSGNPVGAGSTRILEYDVSTPSSPILVRSDRVTGSLVSARQDDDVVRLVMTHALPDLDFVYPDRRRGISQAEARRHNRDLVRATTVSDWLPRTRVREGDATRSEPWYACGDVLRPTSPSGGGTVSVVAFAAGDRARATATVVSADSDLVYSSVDHLYLATTAHSWAQPFSGARLAWEPQRTHTDVHAFALDGVQTTLTASGRVRGWVRDRWSMDEHEGRLRVASALGPHTWNPRENAVTVLEERGDRLVRVGSVAGLGRREDIQSVRWFDDLAILVTFRRIDPLYTVDLTDPIRPRALGELKIPGYSGYLHPLGGDLLLGIGEDATRRGQSLGAQLATFDLSDLTRPARVDTAQFARPTELAALWDPRALTWLAGDRTAFTPLTSYRGRQIRTWLLKVRVGTDGTLDVRRSRALATSGDSLRVLPLDGGRAVAVWPGGLRVLGG